MKGLRDKYEAHHKVTITDGALAASVNLSDRYINDRFLPDKAIDLIDEAGAKLRISRMSSPPEVKEIEEQIVEARRRKEAAIDAQDFETSRSPSETRNSAHEAEGRAREDLEGRRQGRGRRR